MLNKIELIGNLGRDPEIKYLPDGRAVTTMNVATNRTYNDSSGQQIKETTWFRVSVFGKTAEACAQYLHKGSQVFVEGRLTSDKATGGPRIWKRKDGTPGASFEVTASSVRFLGARGETEPAQDTEDVPGTQDAIVDGDIPF